MSKYEQIELQAVKRYSIKKRYSKVDSSRLSIPYHAGSSFLKWFDSLPKILIASDLHEFVDRIVAARLKEKPVILMMGAHVIKVGLSPIVIDLMRQNVITCVATNGAGIVHDSELCLFGQTSEEVADGLADGTFGMVEETGSFINTSILDGHRQQLGLGEAVGKRLSEQTKGWQEHSILGNAYAHDVPATIHVAIGTDIIHQHPDADGEAIGATSFRDFRIFTSQVAKLHDGGVVINFGSNVIMPEVFLKALTVARNIHKHVTNFYTANFDMLQHYRPRVNVVQRPTLTGGKGYSFTGHHEIMMPLLAAAVKEKLRLAQ